MFRLKDVRGYRYAIVRLKDWQKMNNKGLVFVESQALTNSLDEAFEIKGEFEREDETSYKIVDLKKEEK